MMTLSLLIGSCTAAGFSSCCIPGDSASCYGNPPTCYCDEVCFKFDDCCSDIGKICSIESPTVDHGTLNSKINMYCVIIRKLC